MTLPDGWPAEADIEVLPVVYAAFPDAAWPPPRPQTPAGVAAVASWHLERELVGSVLPGNVRARSGLSIGSAGFTLAQTEAGQPLTPWSADPTRRVTAGQPVDLYASHNGYGSEVRVDLGEWLVAPVQGSLVAAEVPVELLERQYRGRALDQALPVGRDSVDPAWIVDTLARQVDHHSTPPAVASTIICAALAGGATPDVGLLGGALVDRWGRATGVLGTEGDAIVIYAWLAPNTVLGSGGGITPIPGGGSTGNNTNYLTVNVVGEVRFTFGVGSGPEVEIHADDGEVWARANSSESWEVVEFEGGLDPIHTNRVQLEMVAEDTTGTIGDWTFRVRARSSADATWSDAAVSPGMEPGSAFPQVTFDVEEGSSVSAFQITSESDDALWATPTAEIHALGGRIPAPWLPPDKDVWSGIQQVCAVHLGACWVRRDKTLLLQNRDYLAGAFTAGEGFDVGQRVEDLGWTLDPSDSADRLEITYSPVDFVEDDGTGLQPVVWAAQDAIELAPFETIEITVDVDFYAKVAPIPRWIGAWDTANLDEGSTWCTYSARDGDASGDLGGYGALSISVRHVSGNRFVLRLTNNLDVTLYTVDADGKPCLILRAPVIAPQANSASVVRGAGLADAVRPLTVDLGKLVQRAEDAEAIADYVWSRVSSPMWKASSVRTRLEWDRDIGDIVQLVHERSGLGVKALVTKVALDGQAGEVAQTLDLVLLPITWGDFDAAWADAAWTDFDDTWSADAWLDFDTNPLRR